MMQSWTLPEYLKKVENRLVVSSEKSRHGDELSKRFSLKSPGLYREAQLEGLSEEKALYRGSDFGSDFASPRLGQTIVNLYVNTTRSTQPQTCYGTVVDLAVALPKMHAHT
jgi:hypothetical protein